MASTGSTLSAWLGVIRSGVRRPGRRRRLAAAAGTLLAAASVCLAAAPASLALGAPGEGMVPSQAVAAHQPQGSHGLTEFGSCLAGSGKGSFVLLIDQSGSLRTTDPDKARVRAAHYLVDRLAALSSSAHASLDVRVAGFAADYSPQGEWTAVSASSAEGIKSAVSAVGDALESHDTDYWNALEGARSDLTDHDSSGCRAIAWLSDGAFDLDVRSTRQARQRYGQAKPYAPDQQLTSAEGVQAAESAGLEDLCRSTGVADQVRSAGITVLGIGLSDGTADFTMMQRVTTAGGSNAQSVGLDQCGEVDSPSGAFYPVSDIDSLLMAFDSISAAGGALESRHVSICQGEVCEQGVTSFVLDSSLDEVHVLASSSVEGLDAYVYQPGASEPVAVSSDQESAQSQGVRSRWVTPRTLEITIASADVPAWDGVWRLAFVDRSSASEGKDVTINLKLTSPVQLVWEDLKADSLRAGQVFPTASIVLYDRPGGKPLDTSVLKGSVKASVALTDAQGHQATLFEAASTQDLSGTHKVTVPATMAPGSGVLTRTVELTTPDATGPDGATVKGTTLAPSVVTQNVTIAPPQNFPSVATALRFPVMEKETTASASLAVTGPGCVWVDPSSLRLTGSPAEAGKVTVTSEHDSKDSCVSVAKGNKSALDLTLHADGQANGAVAATVNVMVAPRDDLGAARPMTVSLAGEMRRPLDVGTATLTFVIALLAGLGLPIGLLYLLKFLSAAIPGGPLVVGRTVVEIPQDGGTPKVAISSEELTQMSLRRGRELSVGQLRLRAHPGLAPTSVPYVRLDAPEAVSVGTAGSDRKGRALLPLNVRGQWLAILDQPDSPRHVTVVVMASSLGTQAVERACQEASARLAQRVQSTANRHKDRLPGAGAAAASAPSGPAAPTSPLPAGAGARSAPAGAPLPGAQGGFASPAPTTAWGAQPARAAVPTMPAAPSAGGAPRPAVPPAPGSAGWPTARPAAPGAASAPPGSMPAPGGGFAAPTQPPVPGTPFPPQGPGTASR